MEAITTILAAIILVVLLQARWPGAVMTIIYPLVWAFWSYNIPAIGKVDRLIGIIGIVGFLFMLPRQHNLGGFPSKGIVPGMFLFLLGFLVAWMFQPESSTSEFLGNINRLVFLFLAYQLIRTGEDIKQVSWLYIASGLFACILTLLASYYFGLGYTRIWNGSQMLLNNFGVLATPALNANFAIAPAALLFVTYQNDTRKSLRYLIALGFSFMVVMAFFSQYRRELLISIPILLIFFALDRVANVQRPAMLLLFIFSLFFVFVLLPRSVVLQDRLETETGAVLDGTETRIMNFRAALTAFSQNPLGYGPGRYAGTIFNVIGPGYLSFQYNSYSVFTSVAVEGGAISLLGLLMILGATWSESMYWRKLADGPEGWVLKSAPILLVCILIWFTFGNALDLGLPWFIIGLILSSVRLAQQKLEIV